MGLRERRGGPVGVGFGMYFVVWGYFGVTAVLFPLCVITGLPFLSNYVRSFWVGCRFRSGSGDPGGSKQ